MNSGVTTIAATGQSATATTSDAGLGLSQPGRIGRTTPPVPPSPVGVNGCEDGGVLDDGACRGSGAARYFGPEGKVVPFEQRDRVEAGAARKGLTIWGDALPGVGVLRDDHDRVGDGFLSAAVAHRDQGLVVGRHVVEAGQRRRRCDQNTLPVRTVARRPDRGSLWSTEAATLAPDRDELTPIVDDLRDRSRNGAERTPVTSIAGRKERGHRTLLRGEDEGVAGTGDASQLER